MARKTIDIGTVGNDGTGDSIRDSFRKVNDNFRELYSSLGLGEKLRFISLDDTPSTYVGQEDAVLAVNATTDGLKFKQVVAGQGIFIDQSTNENEIKINAEFAEISSDPTPQLGGNLSAQSGGQQHRIQDLTTPITSDEAVNKAYADTKVALGGVDTVDPATGTSNSAFGRMSGPLILSRSPEDEDDQIYEGLIAATKSYVDSSGFGSAVNLYVATSGNDDRSNLADNLQGRSLASAFRTIERACKRAEELVLESNLEIGPYKKLLTYNDGEEICTLSKTETSPDSGTGFVGTVTMSVDSVSIVNGGTNYLPGDILEISGSGGAGTFARVEVLSTASTPGAILTFRVLTNGVYTILPGGTNVTTSTDSEFGQGALFDVTYKVNTVTIDNPGTGYTLVSVRITGGGGSGAFGTATVVSGEITNIDITDQGQGFTSLPTVEVDLPRFFIETNGNRTDFTGDVETDTIDAAKGRDIREGLFLRGETSGALAQILAHDGSLDSEGNEIFDVDVKFGSFQIGEPIAYGDRAKEVQICIFVEAGIYEEHLPLKLPANTAIIGDEFRRTLLRPKPGTSSSPWAFQKFRRDTVIDGLTVASQIYGHHYLHDSTQPVYPKIDNPGGFLDSAELLKLNRQFIQKETIAWINDQIENNISPFTQSFNYSQSLCERDIGLLLDAMIFDIKYGEYNRTISAGLKYFESASGRVAITDQLSETIAGIRKVEELAVKVINNTQETQLVQTVFRQVVDPAYTALQQADSVLADLFDAVIDVIDNSGSVNYPEENDKLDVFLCNDANIIRAITCQGQGGFMMVLDPEGQILAKSPYCQESASFSRSTGLQTFAGGMFVDGFAGNLQFTHEDSPSSTRISISGLDRFPELPASFIVDDQIFRINYVRDFVFDKDGSSATFVLDETTPFTLSPGTQSCTISTGAPAIVTRSDHGLQAGATLRFSVSEGGSLPGGIEAGKDYYVLSGGLTANTFRITETFGSIVEVETTSPAVGVVSYQRVYEVLMPGNRSMLSNDYTQVNDMGYGLLATNGGLTEAVSMFTYYCYTSYYSLNGAQIRSIGGSSAHGVFALVAEGADPLEIPTPTELYYDLAQGVECYFPSPSFANNANGLIIFVTNYSYVPLGQSELEIDHGNQIFRYPVTSTSTDGLPAGVVSLNLTSDETGNFEGLFAQVANGTKMSLRSNAKILLTGGLEDVAVRPSTGLVLNETDNVYRVLSFDTADEELVPTYEVAPTVADPGEFSVVLEITDIDGATETCTFSQNHYLRRGDTFVPDSSANGFTAGQTYYVIDVPEYNEAIFSTTAGGSAANLTNLTGGSIKGVVPHKLQAGFTVAFTTTGSYPTGLDGDVYFVLEDGLTATTFQISKLQTGNPIALQDQEQAH